MASGLDAILETLNAHYAFDARGRIVGARADGVLPRFVLGRAVEGAVWRFRGDLPEASVRALARLAGREPGTRFDGELPAPPERLAALQRVLASGESVGPRLRRESVTRGGVACGELWIFD
jgi:hypothetical protein